MFDPKTLCREVANRDRVDGRSLPQLQITACAHETVQRVPPQLRTLLQVLLRPHALGFAKHTLAAEAERHALHPAAALLARRPHAKGLALLLVPSSPVLRCALRAAVGLHVAFPTGGATPSLAHVAVVLVRRSHAC